MTFVTPLPASAGTLAAAVGVYSVKRFARALSALLCLLLIAKSSVGAMLSVTGASGDGQSVPDDCPFVVMATFEGAHVDAVAADHELPTSQGAAESTLPPLHHHHFCGPCVMPAALPAALPLPSPIAGVAPESTPEPLTSAVLPQPLHPPRSRG